MSDELLPITAPAPAAVVNPLWWSRSAHRRKYGLVALRLRQSKAGLESATRNAADSEPGTALGRMAAQRVETLRSLPGVAGEHGIVIPHARDLAGMLHRKWLRQLRPLSDGALLDECVRGEASLIKSIQTLLADEVPPPIRRLLASESGRVSRDIDELRELRRRFDQALLRTEH